MRAAIPTTILIASLVAISVILAGIASTLALSRAQVERLDADLASVIRADYSADPEGTKLAPLGEGIIEAAHADKDSESERLKKQEKRAAERLEEQKKREAERLEEQKKREAEKLEEQKKREAEKLKEEEE